MSNIIKFKKTLKDAVVPSAATKGDVGYDLTAIELVKKMGNNTYMYDTGICVEPPVGFYTEIVPRSSIVKTGYVLSNSVGIIDPHYSGSLKVCFTKVDESMPDLEVPFTKCQLLLKRAEYGVFKEVAEFGGATERGSGGFGSTDQMFRQLDDIA